MRKPTETYLSIGDRKDWLSAVIHNPDLCIAARLTAVLAFTASRARDSSSSYGFMSGGAALVGLHPGEFVDGVTDLVEHGLVAWDNAQSRIVILSDHRRGAHDQAQARDRVA